MQRRRKEKNRKLVNIIFQGSESKLQYILLITRKEIISYVWGREFVVPAHFIIGPKIQTKENDFQGREVKIQKMPKFMAEDDLMLGTSQYAWRKGQTQYRGSMREKAANTVVWNPASDRPILQTMLFNFSQLPPTTLCMDW